MDDLDNFIEGETNDDIIDQLYFQYIFVYVYFHNIETIQRYYRYWKNVKKMNSQILNVMQKLNKIKKQMGICGGYLSSFDPRQPLPLGELKDIHDRIKVGAEQLI